MSDKLPANGGEDPHVSSFVRFDSISAGSYWKAKVDLPEENITAGTVLLIESVRYAEEEMHTIILRAHPNIYDKWVTYEVDGEEESGRFQEHRFLVDDFQDQFIYEPNYQRIRDEEVAKIHAKVETLNSELLEAQQDPAILEHVVSTELDKQEREAREARRADEDDEVPNTLPARIDTEHMPATISSAINSFATDEMVTGMKLAAHRHGEVAKIQANWMQEKTGQIAETLQQIAPYYEERAAAALASTDMVQRGVSKMLKGIETLYLYTGKDVEVETIATGRSAAPDVKLTVCSRKLFVDEEASVYLPVDKWFDFQDIPKFLSMLGKENDLVNQIFPSQRCILVMAATKRNINYGNVWENYSKGQMNDMVFMLIRDGENIHRVISPVASHLGASNLFPSQKDQDAIFKGMDGSNISFKDVQYTDRLERHEVFALHYKRFLTLCAGLDHRLGLFGKFYSGEPGLDFMTLGFQKENFIFLDDAYMVEEDHISLSEWVENHNSTLRSGSRVYISMRLAISEASAPGAFSHSEYSNRSNLLVESPSGYQVHHVVKRSSAPIIKTKMAPSYNSRRTDNFTVNIDLNHANGKLSEGGLAYLCVDRVSLEDIEYFIYNRKTRSNHLKYIELFKNLRDVLTAELKEERTSRANLAKAIDDARIADSDEEAQELVTEAVCAWKIHHKDLCFKDLSPSDGATWEKLLNYAYFYKKRFDYCSEIERLLGEQSRKPLRVVLETDTRLYVYYEPYEQELDDRVERHPWVHKARVNLGKTKLSLAKPRWCKMYQRHAAESVVKDYPGVERWLDLQDSFGSYEAKQRSFIALDEWRETLDSLRSNNEEDVDRNIRKALSACSSVQGRSRYVGNSGVSIPIGLRSTVKGVKAILLHSSDVLPALACLVSDEAAKKKILDAYTGRYQNRGHALKRFNKIASAEHPWEVVTSGLICGKHFSNPFLANRSYSYYKGKDEAKPSPLLSDWVRAGRKHGIAEAKKQRSYRASWVDDNGDIALPSYSEHYASDIRKEGLTLIDNVVGATLPANYEPHAVVRYEVTLTKCGTEYSTIDVYPLSLCWPPEEENEAELGFPEFDDSYRLSPRRYDDVFPTKEAAVQDAFFGVGYHKQTVLPASELDGYPTPLYKSVERFFVVKDETED